MTGAWVIPAGWAGMVVFFGLLWLVQRRTGDAGIVDIGWASGIGLVAIFYAVALEGDVARRALVAALAWGWGFRLAAYIHWRNHGKPEDGRYRKLREEWGGNFQRRLFNFYQFQAVTVVLLSLSPWAAMRNPASVVGPWTAAGVAIWILSVGGEALADAQLARFRRRPENKGRTCRAGLWRYSRHPNYFFEWLHWWVYVLLAAGWGGFWLTLVAPALMLYVLLKVTGIPATEAHALASRGEEYREYQRTTSAFFPWFPGKITARCSGTSATRQGGS